VDLIELVVHVVVKYDHKVFMPLLLAIYNFLAPFFVNVEVAKFVL